VPLQNKQKYVDFNGQRYSELNRWHGLERVEHEFVDDESRSCVQIQVLDIAVQWHVLEIVLVEFFGLSKLELPPFVGILEVFLLSFFFCLLFLQLDDFHGGNCGWRLGGAIDHDFYLAIFL
jgi:hypothetical protein